MNNLNMLGFSFGSTFEDCRDVLQKVLRSKACCLCNKTFEECEDVDHDVADHVFKYHFLKATFYTFQEKKAFSMPCTLNCDGVKHTSKRLYPHFHCPCCKRVFCRNFTFVRHLKGNGFALSNLERHHQHTEVGRKQNNVKKRGCNLSADVCSDIPAPKMKKGNDTEKLFPSICIDTVNGIFMVPFSKSALPAPIHVQSHKRRQIQCCSNQHCTDVMMHPHVQNPAIECIHLRSVSSAKVPDTVILEKNTLVELSNLQILSTKTVDHCVEALELAEDHGVPIVVHADFTLFGYKDRTMYFSVYTGFVDYYCRFSRVRVTFDSQTGVWSCKCPKSTEKKSCIHEALSKWYLFQTQPNKMEDCGRSLCHDEQQQKMMTYFLEKKCIPLQVPQELLQDASPPEHFIPAEHACPLCDGKLLHHKSKNVVVFGCGKIWKGSKIEIKECSECKVAVRFQEYLSGFHNFNNNILLTLKLCSHLLKAVQYHVSVETCLKVLFQEEEIVSSYATMIRNGFYHFCALSSREYNFSCILCGDHPKIVIADGNWKNTCEIPVESVKVDESISEETNVKEVWTSYQKEIIGRGFYDTKMNPWNITVKFSTISPWMGKNSRNGDMLYNTEYKKLSVMNCKSSRCNTSIDLTYEDILTALYEEGKGVSVPTRLKRLCKSVGIESVGSRDDLVNRLSELILFKDVYPKMFRQLKKCGGGIVHFRCVHGIAVYFKYTLRQESARDYIDALLSFKKQPNVVVSDISSQVAHHGENRKQGMFAPYKGMLYQFNDTNCKLYDEGKLAPVHTDISEGSSDFYSLTDKFHQHSKKRCCENAFRNLRFSSNLSAHINSSCAEQSNAVMRKDRQSFCSMNVVNFMFMSRLSLDLFNEAINRKNKQRLARSFGNLPVFTLHPPTSNLCNHVANDNVSDTTVAVEASTAPDRASDTTASVGTSTAIDRDSKTVSIGASKRANDIIVAVGASTASDRASDTTVDAGASTMSDRASNTTASVGASDRSNDRTVAVGASAATDRSNDTTVTVGASDRASDTTVAVGASTMSDRASNTAVGASTVSDSASSTAMTFGASTASNGPTDTTVAVGASTASDREVLKLWKAPPNNLFVALLNGGQCLLNHASFCTLRNNHWLDDSVINYALMLIASNHNNILVLDSFLCTSLLNETVGTEQKVLSNVDFTSVEIVMGAYNKNGTHWNLLFLHCPSGQFFLLNPMGSDAESTTTASKVFRNFLDVRFGGERNPLTAAKWRAATLEHPRQSDGFNCGIYIIEIAKHLIASLPNAAKRISFPNGDKDFHKLRYCWAKAILDGSDDMENVCPICANSGKIDLIDWIRCDACFRRYHSRCLKMKVEELKKAWNCCFCMY